MKLIYTATGQTVQFGDEVRLNDGTLVVVDYYRPPHSPASSGKVSVRPIGTDLSREYYVGVIGAEWIEREDRA